MEPRVSIITLGVSDLDRSYQFYTAMGFESSKSPEEGIIFFKTQGVCLALYPLQELSKDVSEKFAKNEVARSFSGVTLAHNTRRKEEVDEILQKAVSLGSTLEKPAQDVFWGGYSGYFSDPDGHLWEIAYADFWQFKDDGSLVID
ncbi:VOC family protein [Vibrio sp. ZSDE26]|uniref:VOC family protein n=1 Tax=Vibrio amylolyticus TaxID=2847292 RepID=A0A9X1XRA6_9VIBR|nr:VOC family protein [Vibrio amylolyticus]MCK6265705.1 VOC family protein [Vibrio amylolyticus]